MTVFAQVAAEQLHNAKVQKYKYNYTYTVSALIEPSKTEPVALTIESDADFMFEKMTGSAYGPCNSNGLPQVANTDFPMPGIAAGAGFAGRGVTVEIEDSGNNRPLTRGAVPVELLLSPGYGQQFHLPYPIKYFALRTSVINFKFTNRDSQANANHQVDIAINGYKFEMPVPQTRDNPSQQIRQNANVAGY